MGAIASGGVVVMNDEVVKAMNVQADDILDAIASERRELARREEAYRDGRPPADVRGKTVILIDDGLATGSTMRAAVTALRRQGPARIVVAVPIGAASTCAEFQSDRRRLHLRLHPRALPRRRALVRGLLPDRGRRGRRAARPRTGGLGDGALPERGRGRARARPSATVSPPGGPPMNDPRTPALDEQEVAIPAGRRTLRGTLSRPRGASAVVVFAHGSGSGRFSPRNQYVARVLQEAGLATLLLDLLEEDEANDRSKVFDIELLADRLQAAADWLAGRPETAGLRLGYFGASTGAGAALLAAGRDPDSVGAVVSRGGRPDLAARRAAPRHGADPADRRRQRRDRPGAQPRGLRPARRHPPARHRPRRHPPVRGARYPRGSLPPGPRMVPPLPDARRRQMRSRNHQGLRRMTPADSVRQEEPRITRIHTNKKTGMPRPFELRPKRGSGLIGASDGDPETRMIRENSCYSWFLPFSSRPRGWANRFKGLIVSPADLIGERPVFATELGALVSR